MLWADVMKHAGHGSPDEGIETLCGIGVNVATHINLRSVLGSVVCSKFPSYSNESLPSHIKWAVGSISLSSTCSVSNPERLATTAAMALPAGAPMLTASGLCTTASTGVFKV